MYRADGLQFASPVGAPRDRLGVPHLTAPPADVLPVRLQLNPQVVALRTERGHQLADLRMKRMTEKNTGRALEKK